ncbi:hypothetical protein LCGC14_2844100, partial [marine sediment metagenome]
MSDVFRGLPDAAKDFLANHVPICPHCKVPWSYPKRIGSFFDSSHGTHSLFKHKLRGGETVYEFLQVVRICGNDAIFYLGLRTSG